LFLTEKNLDHSSLAVRTDEITSANRRKLNQAPRGDLIVHPGHQTQRDPLHAAQLHTAVQTGSGNRRARIFQSEKVE
jgi:hypothetical protein